MLCKLSIFIVFEMDFKFLADLEFAFLLNKSIFCDPCTAVATKIHYPIGMITAEVVTSYLVGLVGLNDVLIFPYQVL